MRGTDRLTALDATFLYAESPTAHMHVGALSIYEPFELTEATVLDQVTSRLHLVPRFRQKLAWVPLQQGRPVWVDDPHFDIKNHVLFTGLPRPGGEQQLLRLTERILSHPLDRRRPLWELWVVDLSDGRSAIITKTHHCLVDGISTVDIGTALLDLSRDAPQVTPKSGWQPAPAPSRAKLLRDALFERLTQPTELAHAIHKLTGPQRAVVSRGLRVARGVMSFSKAGLEKMPPTSFNHPIGPHRRFRIARMRLDDLKVVRRRFDCTLNDVVLTCVAGGLRRLLLSRGEPIAGQILKAMVPVSVRATTDRNTYGNKVSWVRGDIPVGLERAEARLSHVHRNMAELKEANQAVGAEVWAAVSEYAPPTVLVLAGRATAHQKNANLVVTNVPGPQFPLFFRGAKMLEAFPVVPIMGVTSLGVAVLSYDGQLNFGLNADWDLFPDLSDLAEGIVDAGRELLELASAGSPSETPRRDGL